VKLVVSALLVAVVAAACGATGQPVATPGGFGDVVGALVLHGVAVHEQVSGDDGCPRVELHDNAMRLTVSVGDDTARRDVYLFRWRRAIDFDASVQSFFMCVTDFRSNHPGTVIEVVEQRPWRAFGADWSLPLKQAVTDALAVSAGG
jgi:hypothetical protein